MDRALREALADLQALPKWLDRYDLSQLPPGRASELLEVAARLRRDDAFGFLLAERLPLESGGIVARVLEVAPTFRAAADYDRWSVLLRDSLRHEYCPQGRVVWIRCLSRHERPLGRTLQDYRMAQKQRIMSRMLGRPHDLIEVHFTYPRPRSTRAHEATFPGARLRFSQPLMQYAIAADVVDEPLPGADPLVFAELRAELERYADASQPDDWYGLMLMQRREREYTALTKECLGREMGMSVSTLTRRLASHGLSFRALMDQVRLAEAELLLERGEMTLDHVAAELGFANRGAFIRAFRRWTGQTPGRFQSQATVSGAA